MPQSLKLVTVWLLIATALFLAVQAMQRQAERSRFSFDSASGRIELTRAPDGHFHWPGRVNGVAVDFLVDTGATSTALPLALAQEAGLVLEGAMRSSTLSPSCIAPRPWWLVPMKSTSPGCTGVIAVAQAIDSAIECARSEVL